MESNMYNQKLSLRNWKYFLSLIPAILVVFGNLTGGWFTLSNFLFSFVILALSELILPEDKRNDDSVEDHLPEVLLFLSVIAQVISISSLIYGINSGIISGYWIFAAALSTGTSSGTIAIVVAHELIHRKEKVWNFAGRFLLFSVFNPYFYVHHLRIHHKHVGTFNDPVTARKNETYYHYLWRSVTGQLIQSFEIESKRCEKLGRSKFSLHNYMIACFAGYIMLLVASAFLFGWQVVAALIMQAYFANSLLEYTNYIEHYGLSRAENQRVNETHSWQSDKFISRFFLIDLSRHADHHFHAAKPFHQLLSHSKSPVMPGGYASMFLPALIPPLWFALVNKKIPKEIMTPA